MEAASAVRRRFVRRFLDSAMATDEEVQRLLELLYRQPEIATYSFHREGQQMNGRLLAAERLGHLQIVETQRHWYAHPNFDNDFVRVMDPTFEWEKELVATGAKLLRSELAITEQERRRREIEDTAAAISRHSQVTPETPWERLEHHYRRNSAAYYVVALVLGIAGLAVAFL